MKWTPLLLFLDLWGGIELAKGKKAKKGKNSAVRKATRWIQDAVRHPGRVKKYLRRQYGEKAFTESGEIKQEYVHKAIREIKERPPSKRPPGLLQALHLAKRFELMRKDKKG